MLLTYSILVTGEVQGVFFRQTAQEKARKLGVQGTVMNKEDGTVAIVATGTRELLDAFVEWCKEGPPRARVKDVEVKEIPLQHFGSFTIERR